MTAPIEIVYAAFTAAVADALVAAEFVPASDKVQVDPPNVFTPTGNESVLVTAAAVVQWDTMPDRSMLGGGSERFAVKRKVTVELAAAGPARPAREAKLRAACVAVVALSKAENAGLDLTAPAGVRVIAETMSRADLPPNGLQAILSFSLTCYAAVAFGLS